jgi:hypothetical protein
LRIRASHETGTSNRLIAKAEVALDSHQGWHAQHGSKAPRDQDSSNDTATAFGPSVKKNRAW